MSKRWDKNATTFRVVYRGHDDPRYHDSEASEHVLVPVENPNNRKVKNKSTLEKELGEQMHEIRNNEGEAALYGITFDDSKYDYMQHLKPMGQGDGVFIPSKTVKEKSKKKDILFKEDLKDVLPPEKTVQLTYQDQQAIPDDIAGFQPDMNPALREVLEALEDEAYVDDDDNIFDNLLKDGELVDEDEFEDQIDEWDLDNYEDEFAQYDDSHYQREGDEGWEADFRKFKATNKKKANDWDSDDEFEEEEEDNDVVPELPSLEGSKAASSTQKSKKGAKQKARRKMGAMTDLSSFSLSSSSVYRTEGLRLLDDKFEVMREKYENNRKEQEEEDDNKKPFDMSTERADLEDLLDDFLDNYEIEGGRRLVKKNPELDKLKKAADSVSRGKLAQKRKKQSGLKGLESSLSNMKI
ncbi:LTV1 [Cyberlindnera jadinii]|uniref:LTV1 protein n=1 Tax=Cyberlindnera jadinii (strain ATCC 18201 / CBS 1600 / BCRC 20928 / JCM 3617 / NBRC 0987 / NRRL Y-1542) TaxID=983966 RepID=A0A0H5C089_CYBJN|nr:Low temperature viability protein [Cyberlindnera jadinii NRRL Y-1542]ODV76410.1 Low temperature viability protein [Cyberlindnera jadinii NRRL Y-1542]CEP21051.1 LTV1 [Cyberlindnera jadinii]